MATVVACVLIAIAGVLSIGLPNNRGFIIAALALFAGAIAAYQW